MSEYTVSGCDVSTAWGAGSLAAVEGGPVDAAVPSKRRTTAAMTSTAVSDMDEPGSGKARDLLPSPPGCGVLRTVPARYRSPGPQLITPSWLCCSACCESHRPGRSKEWHPAADLHKFLT